MTLEEYQSKTNWLSWIVKFYTEWCWPCKVMTPVLNQISEELNIPLISSNAQEDPVAHHMWITRVPTILLYKDWSIVEQIQWAIQKDDLVSLLEHHSIA